MDSQEQSVDQRKQPLNGIRRSLEEWELIACKVQLLFPDYAAYLRDNVGGWHARRVFAAHGNTLSIMRTLQIRGTCAPITFVEGTLNALRRMAREARVKIQQENIHGR